MAAASARTLCRVESDVPLRGLGFNVRAAAGSTRWSTRRTTWTAHAVTQLDYFIATSSASAGASAAAGEIMRAFADAVGHAPPLPSFAAGYWHSKNRYESAEQLLDAAHGFYSRKSQKRD